MYGKAKTLRYTEIQHHRVLRIGKTLSLYFNLMVINHLYVKNTEEQILEHRKHSKNLFLLVVFYF